MPNASLADLIAQSGASAPAFFTKTSTVGETVTGRVVSVNVRQVNDFVTNKPATWDDGSPRLQVHVTIQTEMHDNKDDDGKRSVYVKWWTHQRRAFLEAVAAAGIQDLEPDDIFTAAYVGTEPSDRKGFDDTKIFEYEIVRPV